MKRFYALAHIVVFFIASAFISGCGVAAVGMVVGSSIQGASYQDEPKNYRSAGFDSKDEVREYAPHYLYFAFNLSDQEWRVFYETYPEYWQQIQQSKTGGFGARDYNPGYTAYAFRWTTLNRMKNWPQDTVTRLNNKQILPGDNVFKIVYSLGSPRRLVWDNDFELLIYEDGLACIMDEGLLSDTKLCEGCCDEFQGDQRMEIERSTRRSQTPEDFFKVDKEKVIKRLGLKRPSE